MCGHMSGVFTAHGFSGAWDGEEVLWIPEVRMGKLGVKVQLGLATHQFVCPVRFHPSPLARNP